MYVRSRNEGALDEPKQPLTIQFLFLCQHVCTLSAKLWKKTVCIAKDWF